MGKAEGSVAREEWHGHVTALSVAPEFRRLGLAAKLMEMLEEISERFVACGVTIMWTDAVNTFINTHILFFLLKCKILSWNFIFFPPKTRFISFILWMFHNQRFRHELYFDGEVTDVCVTVALRRVAGRADSSWTSSCESPTRWPWTCTNVWATASTGRWSSTTPPATASLTKTRTVSPRTQSVYGEKLEKFRCFQIQKSKAWAPVLPQKCNFFVRMSQTPHYLWTYGDL